MTQASLFELVQIETPPAVPKPLDRSTIGRAGFAFSPWRISHVGKPLAIDLYCGLGGWTEGFLAEGWDVVGFDIERHQYGQHKYPAQLVLQDVLTLHGSQFRGRAAVIVASSPCQKYSYMAMPWKRAKDMAAWYREDAARQVELNELFLASFRIAKEAGIPIIAENVKGAQPWVGTAAWHYGSFYLWGDVPALMPPARHFGHANKRDGHSHTRQRESDAIKQHGSGPAWFDDALNERRKEATAVKNGGDWFSSGEGMSKQRACNSRSDSRKAASAMIAKIPFELSSYIARVFKP